MTPHFVTLVLQGDRLVESSVRELSLEALRRCRWSLFDPEHYREDGTCKCDSQEERDRLCREYDYAPSDFEGIPLRKEE